MEEVRSAFVDSVPWLVLGLIVSGALEAVAPSKDTVAAFLGTGGASDVLKGAIVGSFLPLCSCGALPVALSLGDAGASPQAVVAFLTAAQSAGVDSAVITYGVLGAPVAVARLLSSLVLAVAAGLATPLGAAGTKAVSAPKSAEPRAATSPVRRGFLGSAAHGVWHALTDTFDEVAGWVALGLVVTAAITVYAPEGGAWLGKHAAARVAVLTGTLPLQLCEHGTVTFAGALRRAGASGGTAFAFLISAPATNLATMALLLRRQPGGSLGVVRIASALVISGLAVSYLFDASGVQFEVMPAGHDLPPWAVNLCFYVTAALVAGSAWRRVFGSHHKHE